MIIYHGTPIGGNKTDAKRFLHGRHALVSFARPDQLALVADVCSSFIFDNGAFSFWRNKVEPDWDAYMSWVQKWAQHPGFDWWLIPDVIDGTEDDNFKLIFRYANEAPFGVPVYHMHESLEYLQRLAKSFPRIAIGSSGRWKTPGSAEWWGRMREVLHTICDEHGRPICKLHGLRMLNPLVFTNLPLSSADSTNVGRNNHESDRFGIYMPPSAGLRAEVIASRIEVFNSAPIFTRKVTK